MAGGHAPPRLLTNIGMPAPAIRLRMERAMTGKTPMTRAQMVVSAAGGKVVADRRPVLALVVLRLRQIVGRALAVLAFGRATVDIWLVLVGRLAVHRVLVLA